MSQQSDANLQQGMNVAKTVSKPAAGLAKKAGKKAGKTAIKGMLLFPKITLIVAAFILLVIMFVVAGSSAPIMTKTEYLTADKEVKWNIPKTSKAEEESLYEEDANIKEAEQLITVIHKIKQDQKEKTINEVRNLAAEYGCNETLSMAKMVDNTDTFFSAFKSAGNIKERETHTKVWKFLKANGYSDEAAAGIMGNIEWESHFKDYVTNGGENGAIGLCQWSGSRNRDLKNYAANKNKPWKELNIQLDFMIYEINKSYKRFTYSKFKNTNDIAYATEEFLKGYERPFSPGSKDYYDTLEKRRKSATEFYQKYRGIQADGSETAEDINIESTVSGADMDILSCYSVSVGNGQMIMEGEPEEDYDEEDDKPDENITYVDITGKEIPLYWIGKNRGLPDYKHDLKKKLEDAEKNGFRFYEIDYEKNPDGTPLIQYEKQTKTEEKTIAVEVEVDENGNEIVPSDQDKKDNKNDKEESKEKEKNKKKKEKGSKEKNKKKDAAKKDKKTKTITKYKKVTVTTEIDVPYIATYIKDKDVTAGNDSLAQEIFNVDPTEKYMGTDKTHGEVIRSISMQTMSSLGAQVDEKTILIHGEGILANPLGDYKYVVTSPFGYRFHPITGEYKGHTGIDLGAVTGTPIYAAEEGTVVRSDWYGGYGCVVDIMHEDRILTRYAHQNYFGPNGIIVQKGQHVVKGQLIGHVGSTGDSTGPHLHFEVQVNGAPNDPQNFVHF